MWFTAAKIGLGCLAVIGFLLLLGVSIGVIGFVIGVIGLLISAIAIPYGAYLGGKQLKQLDMVREGLDGGIVGLDAGIGRLQEGIVELRGEIQTHHIGSFPKFLPEIVEILDRAERKITIFCDLPAYGVVSARERFPEYAELIERKASSKDFEVRLLHLDHTRRIESLESQFRGSWAELCKEPSVSDFVQKSAEPLNGDDPKRSFLELVETRQEETLASFERAGVKAVPTGLIMPLYFWIADRKSAVFALTEFSPRAHEVGFRTGSTNLIEAMTGIYNRYSERPAALSGSSAEVGEQVG